MRPASSRIDQSSPIASGKGSKSARSARAPCSPRSATSFGSSSHDPCSSMGGRDTRRAYGHAVRRIGSSAMGGRIVLFGATGYTGDLTARAMVDRGLRPVLAGRDAERLAALAGDLGGLDAVVADAGNPDSVRALVQRGDVLVTTVGPFAQLGEPAVHAAVTAGVDYLDAAGEPKFIRDVFERHGPQAEAAGCALVPAFGYDWVPGNLAAALALGEADEAAASVEIGYFAPGRGMTALSPGTRATLVSIAVEPAFAWRAGRLATVPSSSRWRTF